KAFIITSQDKYPYLFIINTRVKIVKGGRKIKEALPPESPHIIALFYSAYPLGLALLAPGVKHGAENEGQVGLFLVRAAAGQRYRHTGSDHRAASHRVRVDEPALDQRIRRGQVRSDDAVEAAARPGAVIILQPSGL